MVEMNIFVLDEDPKRSAQLQCNQHTVKMILESVQMISTCARINGIDRGYKSTHENHPCTVWVRESKQNLMWLVNYVHHMKNEWNYRWQHNRQHKAVEMMLYIRPETIRLPNKGLTEFARTVPEEYIHGTVVDTYRSFYCSKEFATWKRRPIPNWWMPPQSRPSYIKPGVSVEYAKT